MITYAYSIQGTSHIKKDKVCQDASKIAPLKKGWEIAVIADGVGSAKYSEIGSNLAVEKATEYCKKNFPKKVTNKQLKELLFSAYQYALDSIIEYVTDKNGRIEDYDTTLSTVIYNGKTVVWAHSGDGGIIVREINGNIWCITERQKGVDGISVTPLRGGDKTWKFGIYEQEVSAVLLATDGVLDGVMMPYLLNVSNIKSLEDIVGLKKDKVYVTAVEFFMNPRCVFRNKSIADPMKYLEEVLKTPKTIKDLNILNSLKNTYSSAFGKEAVKQIVESVKKYNYFLWSIDKVTDDKTVACIINDKCKMEYMLPENYIEPDWELLSEKYNKIIYPDMYRQKGNTDENESSTVNQREAKPNDEQQMQEKNSRPVKRKSREIEELNDRGRKQYRNNRKKVKRKDKRIMNIKCLLYTSVLLNILLMFLLVVCIRIILSKENRAGDKVFQTETIEMQVTTKNQNRDKHKEEKKESSTKESSIEQDKESGMEETSMKNNQESVTEEPMTGEVKEIGEKSYDL